MVLSLMMIACTHSDKSQRMAQLLQQAEQQNQDYVKFTSDPLMKEVVKYYETGRKQVDKEYSNLFNRYVK